MDFESPEIEKDFPGLYSSQASRKNNGSDFSDDSHDKSFKSDLIGKKKEKKDSKKDRGYAALEGESSQDEGDSKSPSKSKKTKSFKFPVKKTEKRDKSRDKEVKEKDVEKDKKKEKKDKVKAKDKRKNKTSEDGPDTDVSDAVFGVPLSKAVKRLACLDGVNIPLPVRHAIDCIHASGLTNENLYKNATVKTKLQTLKKSYNSRNPLITELDNSQAVALLITFLKDLPENILTSEFSERFEEAGAIQDVAQREDELCKLINQLPDCNNTLLSWLIVHFDHITQHEKQNKINAQSIAMTFSPVLQMSHRLLTAFLCHRKTLFSDTTIFPYVPPLAPGSTFPEEQHELVVELRKQEALLNQIHFEMSEGFVCKKREEQLWEVQRIVTQLKRKLRSIQKLQESQLPKHSDEDTQKLTESKVTKIDVTGEQSDIKSINLNEKSQMPPKSESDNASYVCTDVKIDPKEAENEDDIMSSESCMLPEEQITTKTKECSFELPSVDRSISEMEVRLQLENSELYQLHAKLQDRLEHERRLAQKFRNQIETYRGFIDSDSDESSAGSTPAYLSPETEAKLEQLLEENQQLTLKRDELVRKVMEEREACMKLNVSINYIEVMQSQKTT